MSAGGTNMHQTKGRRGHYLLQAEEAEDLANLFLEGSAREKWLNIAKAYRLLAGQPENTDETSREDNRIRKSAA